MRSFSASFDWLLITPMVLLIGCGLLILASISPALFAKQLTWALVGVAFVFAIPLIGFTGALRHRSVVLGLYAASLIALILTQLFGTTVNGSTSWIEIGPLQFQASEFAKFSLIILLAAFFAKRHVGIRRLDIILGSFAYCFLPALLILMEPDLGSALVLFGVWFGFLVVAGLPLRYLGFSILLSLVILAASWQFALKGYQKDRILAVFNPRSDPLGVNYNVIQSKVAIGSSGIFGKGFGQGAMVQLGFLPAAPTDFALSAFIEEWGVLGGLTVLLLFLLLLARIAAIGLSAESNFPAFIALGAIVLFSVQFAINVGSALGFLPVIGVTFPFVSYGGSSLLTNCLLVGTIHGIASRSVS